MFNTIKSKILFIVLLMLSVLILLVSVLTVIFFKNSEDLIVDSYSRSISVLAQNINKEVIAIEDNARDLAVFGEIYFKTKNRGNLLQEYVIKIFDNYEESLGGGIWYEPFLIDLKKRLSCIYAYRNKQNKVITDKNFESDEYDYLNQNWYKEISQKVNLSENIAWSLPYHEKIGSEALMVTAGAGIFDGNKLVGISTVDWEITTILNSILKIKPTPNSFTLFADTKNDYIIACTDKYLNNDSLIGKSLKNIPWYKDDLIKIRYYSYHHKTYIPYVKHLDNGMVLIVNIPKWELFRIMIVHVLALFVILIIFSILLSLLLYKILNVNIINPIDKLIEIANKIGKGDSDIHIKIDKPEEFAHLASTFDTMTENIKTITKKQSKLDLELAVAKSIQTSSLPNVFPPFPERKEFDIYASMTAAKEVGGDFYDFYFTGPETFMFLIADVSGKGIPASLFMMKAKTLIANLSQTSCKPKELIEKINKKLCEDNNEGLFITMFAGILNIYTGELACINCGHNPPLIKKFEGNFEYFHLEPNVMLGAFKNAEYQILHTKLEDGDRIFLYTDGITEAENKSYEMFGEDRLLKTINENGDKALNKVLDSVKSSVKEFAGDMEQSDDITMLILEYNGSIDKRTFKRLAIQENYKDFYSWIHENCDDWQVDDKLKGKIDMCAEEIFANIIFYAFPNQTGTIEVLMYKYNDDVILTFTDEGIPYNPLEKPDPDITLPPKERPIGGLGIYMVKQMAKKVNYQRQDDKNIFTIVLS